MNNNLTNAIVEHIFANFGIIETDFIDKKNSSLISGEYKIIDTIICEDGVKCPIYACQLSISDKELSILATDVIDNQFHDYYMIIQLKDAPTYGLYLDPDENQSMISCLVSHESNKDWMICNTYLQATFLAGMEQVKDVSFGWKKNFSCKEQINLLISFMKYHINLYNEEPITVKP